jgi:hypothetical protein
MNAITRFDYASLATVGDKELVMAAAERIRTRMSRTGQDIVDIGRDLIGAKKRLGHGRFLAWIEAEFGMTDRSARRFMEVAESFKSDTVSDLTPTVLYALAAPSTPDEVRTEATSRAAAGEVITLDEVKRLKDEWAKERGDLRRQVDEAKGKAKDSRASQSDLAQQVSEMRQELAELYRERDLLRHRLDDQSQSSHAPQEVADEVSIDPIEQQVGALLSEWDRSGEQARRKFLQRVQSGESRSGLAA